MVAEVRQPLLPKEFEVVQQTLSTTASLALPINKRRKRALVRNLSATIVVWLGHDSSVASTNGYPLAPGTDAGESIAHNSQAELWVVAASGAPKIAIMEEEDQS